MDPPGGPEAANRWVAHEDHVVDRLGSPPAQVFHAGFVVDDHVRVVPGEVFHEAPEDQVRVAVAARALAPAHGDEVHALALCHGTVHLHLEVGLFGHPRGNRGLFVDEPGKDGADRGIRGHADRLGQVRVRVCVHDQDRALALLQKAPDDEGRQGSLPHAALSTNCYSVSHLLLLSACIQAIECPVRNSSPKVKG